jgi:hypothetical protein
VLRPSSYSSYSDICNLYFYRVTDHVPHLHKTDNIYWSNYLLTNGYTSHHGCCWFWCRVLVLFIFKGRAIAQAVRRWFPTAATRVRAQVRSCGICGGQSGTGAGLLQVLRFPLSIIIPPTAPHTSSIIRGRYKNPNSGRRAKWTHQSHPTPKNLKESIHGYF